MDKITGHDTRPLYQQIREKLKGELTQGTWKPGELLPTELQLSEHFGVSSGTMRQAISGLVQDGLLNRRAGKGTFVARLEGWQSFDRFFGFRNPESEGEFLPTIKVLEAKQTKTLPAEMRQRLGLSGNASAFVLRRALLQDDTTVCTTLSYFPYDLVTGIENEDLTQRLYPLLERRFNIYVVKAEEYLGAGAATKQIARLLGVEEGSPVISIDRIVQTYKERTLECRTTIGRSDKFRYRIQLR